MSSYQKRPIKFMTYHISLKTFFLKKGDKAVSERERQRKFQTRQLRESNNKPLDQHIHKRKKRKKQISDPIIIKKKNLKATSKRPSKKKKENKSQVSSSSHLTTKSNRNDDNDDEHTHYK